MLFHKPFLIRTLERSLSIAVLTILLATGGWGRDNQSKGAEEGPEILAVLNGATNVTDDQPDHAVSPGSVVSVYGNSFAKHLPSPAPVPLSSENIPLEATIADTTITFDGISARFFVISRNRDFPEEQRPGFDQANVQVPWEVMAVPQKTTSSVIVTSNGVSSDPFEVEIAPASPGIFTFLAGPGPAIVQNLDGSFAQPENFLAGSVEAHPAAPGEVIIVWANGLGPVLGTVSTGDVPGFDEQGNAVLPPPQKEVRVFIDGELADSSPVLHPTLVGLFQVNTVVPEDAEPSDEVSILIEVDCGDGNVFRSRADVTIAVREATAPPSITSVSPVSPQQSPDPQTIQINGSGFQAGLVAIIRSPTGTPIDSTILSTTATSFELMLALAAAGSYDIQVQVGDSVSNVFPFTVTETPPSLPMLTSIGILSNEIQGGNALMGTVTLDRPAPFGGALVTLQSNNPAVSLPPSVTVGENQTTVDFTVQTQAVATVQIVVLTATYEQRSVTTELSVTPPPLPAITSLSISQASVPGGNSVTGTVNLDGPAPVAGALITLMSSNSAASVPSNVTVPQNQMTVDFAVQTQTVTSAQTATLTATYEGNSVSAVLQVTAPPPAASGLLVISQLYGGGGNAGATLRNDFIEIFNRGTTPVNLQGWTVQYASASGSQWDSTLLTGTIQPGRYHLVQEGMGQSGGTQSLPTPDVIGGIGLSASSGKVALVKNTTSLSGAMPSNTNIVDFVGYGTANHAEGNAAVSLTNTTGLLRSDGGCTDTDNNAADLSKVTPTPRNSSSPAHSCS